MLDETTPPESFDVRHRTLDEDGGVQGRFWTGREIDSIDALFPLVG